jgi:hypothetical protein
MRLRVEKYRKLAPDRRVSVALELFGRRAHDYPITLLDHSAK